MTIIDFHNHFFPPEYLKAIETGPSNVKVTFDDERNPILHYPGDYNVAVKGHRDIAYRQEVLEKMGIQKQVLTFTTPGTHIETPARAVALARLVNDAFAKIVAERGKHFTALATLPLNDLKASVQEFNRATHELGFAGAMLFSNVNGKALTDKEFLPLYERANERGAVLYIHPVDPVGVEAMLDYWLMPLIGFTFDTTLAAAKIVFSGIPERFPKIRWVLGHLGGAIPYLVERLDRGFYAFEDCRKDISKPPSEYLKHFYYDTVNFDVGALKLAIDFAGVSQILAGSDYPHQIGSIEKMKDSIAALKLSNTDTEAIYGGNAAKLLGLK